MISSRLCMRTGLRMISPSASRTLKYSAPGNLLTSALGRVIWFLEVSLASIAVSLFPYCKE